MDKYCGNKKPFIYAVVHGADSEEAMSIMEDMAGKGHAVWFADDFSKKEQKRMDRAAAVLLFLSPEAVEESWVNDALNYAAQHEKPMITVYLKPTGLKPGQKLMLNSLQGIMKYACGNDSEFYTRLYGAPVLQNLAVTPAQKRSARTTMILLNAFIAVIIAVIVLSTVLFSAGGMVQPDSLLADLGFSGRTGDIDAIYIYGDQTREENLGISLPLKKYEDSNGQPPSTGDYLWMIDPNETSDFGTLVDIADLSQLKNLKELALAGNAILDPSPLYALKKLTYLDISNNPVAALTGIEIMPALKTLNITYTNVTDLTPLLNCPVLQTVYMDDALYAAHSRIIDSARFDVRIVGSSDELPWLSVHIFGGWEEWGDESTGYGVYIRTTTWKLYPQYTYEFRKNGTLIGYRGPFYQDESGDGEEDKTHLYPNTGEMDSYDPKAAYTLTIIAGNRSATYQIWHKFDESNPHAGEGLLLESNE